MLDAQESGDTIVLTISSERAMLGTVMERLTPFLRRFAFSDFSKMKVVLRELLVNAIEHGNHCGAHRKTTCRIERVDHLCFRITVEDEGEGFRHDLIDMSLPLDPRRVENHGYVLINAFSDSLQFNDSGNRVTAYVTVAQDIPAGTAKGKNTETTR
ncbi:MAG: hypothetical protein GWP08_01215 [Nitrospiraceae bacterium]|nr:hypothetical protein [Nitrospiraceae bacterium]